MISHPSDFAARAAATVLFLSASALAQSPNATLDAALEQLLADAALDGARVGVLVRDLADGATLASHDAAHGYMTASNMKLVASSVALVTLGPDHRFATTLIATGPITDGVLHGDLVLVGSGDPTFGGRQEEGGPRAVLDRMVATMVERHGIRRIDGAVLGDDDCHPDEVMGEGWAWGYQGASYAAQVGGLCFAENTVTLRVSPAAPGAAPDVATVPDLDLFDVENRALVGPPGSATELWADRRRGSNRLVVGGRIAGDAETWERKLSVENPTLYAATALRQALVDAGIEVTGPALDRDDRPERPDRYGDELVLVTHESPPLAEILHTLNKVSQNLYAEQLWRAAARSARGQGGARAATVHAKATLASLGVDVTGMRIADGSGLTRLNLVRPQQLVELLTGMWNGPHRDVFVTTLPVAGVDGTLRRRFAEGPAHGHVHAKTGYISSVVALSGYVERAEDGAPPLVFSILVNNFTAATGAVQGAVDTFVNAVATHAGW